MNDIAFRHLIFARSMTVAAAAEKYGCHPRTVRMWLARWPIGVKINDGRHRISEPLLDLCVSDDPDERAAVEAFLDGKPAGALVHRAFEYCGASLALERFEFHRTSPAMKGLADPIQHRRHSRPVASGRP